MTPGHTITPRRRRLSVRHIADQLGHARPSTTLDHYLGRRAITTSNVADALTELTAVE